MKKIIYLLFIPVFFNGFADAKQVEADQAQLVAQNFIVQNAKLKPADMALAFTEKSASGIADYYVFSINNNTGFVIVSAEDAGSPIIGYSTESSYQNPSGMPNSNFNFWMQKRKEEIEYMRDHNLQPDAIINAEWNSYLTNKPAPPKIMSTVHTPVCLANWDQLNGGGTPYNAYCPGGTVTGCVATAMSIIMKKWAFPTKGIGQNTYNEATYGTLTANFGATTYNWANMSTTSSNSEVAKIMYHCGVSVNMIYGTAGSASQVYGAKPSAQYSYVNYFGYDPGIHSETQAAYTVAGWNAMLEAEFAAGRPVQYQGVDASQGGHSWVCDGNDANDKMHMNWGWGGYANGYYAVTALSVPGKGLNFTTQLGALVNIKPKVSTTAVESMDAAAGFNIYPNPAISEVIIEGTANSENVKYSICNMLGAEILSGDIAADTNGFSVKVQVADLPRGMYFLKVTDGSNVSTKKLYKQ